MFRHQRVSWVSKPHRQDTKISPTGHQNLSRLAGFLSKISPTGHQNLTDSPKTSPTLSVRLHRVGEVANPLYTAGTKLGDKLMRWKSSRKAVLLLRRASVGMPGGKL